MNEKDKQINWRKIDLPEHLRPSGDAHFKRFYKLMIESPELEDLVETVVYMYIYNAKKACYIGSLKTLSRWTKSSIKTVQRAIERLKKKGLLSVSQRKGLYGVFNKYEILRLPSLPPEVEPESETFEESERFWNFLYE